MTIIALFDLRSSNESLQQQQRKREFRRAAQFAAKVNSCTYPTTNSATHSTHSAYRSSDSLSICEPS